MKRIFAIVVVVGIICVSLAGCAINRVPAQNADVSETEAEEILETVQDTVEQEATTGSFQVEGPGYASAQEAVEAYLAALKNADLDGMMTTFALETYVENYDFEAQLERIQAYMPTMDPSLPNTNEFTSDLNRYQRMGSIANSIRYQYATLFMSDLALNESVRALEENEVAALVEQLGDPTYLEELHGLEVLEFIEPEALSDQYVSEKNQENLQRLANIYGADEVQSVGVVVQIGSQDYLLCFDAVCYDGKWYTLSLGGNIGALVSMNVTSGGVMPYNTMKTLQ